MLRTFAHLALTLTLAIPIGASAPLSQIQASSNVQLGFTKQLNCDRLGITREQKNCFSKTYKQADQRLKQVNSRLISFFQLDKSRSEERQRKLSRAEKAWVDFRDSNCEFRSSGWDDEKREVFLESCRARMTQERAQELEEFLQRGG